MLAIAIPAGLLIGLSLGALGGGGSILTVPVLVYLLHQPPYAATAGSLLIVGITATAGMAAHRQAGRVRLAPAGHPSRTAAVRRGLKVVAVATGVGLLTGFFGVGGGFVIVPALVLALGFEMPVAVGTSLLVIAINSAAALTARIGTHVHFAWPLARRVHHPARRRGRLLAHPEPARAGVTRSLAWATLLGDKTCRRWRSAGLPGPQSGSYRRCMAETQAVVRRWVKLFTRSKPA